MLSGVSYEKIKARYKFQGKVTGRSAKPPVSLLQDLGVKCDEKSTKIADAGALKNLHCDALVYFKTVAKTGEEGGGRCQA